MNITTAETVTIAGRTFQVERTDDGNIFLHGNRGAVYFLRSFIVRGGQDTGVRVIVSWKSGNELRNKCGELVRVAVLGGEIEEIAPRKIAF